MNDQSDILQVQNNGNVLVCITPQSNSKRLIKKGADLAFELKGELHILHVQKGKNIFQNKSSVVLLDTLFRYGSTLGGTIHALASENVVDCISTFAKNMNVSTIVVGEAPQKKLLKLLAEDIINQIKASLPYAEFIVVSREENSKSRNIIKTPQMV